MTFAQALAAMAADLAPLRLALIGSETLVGDLVGGGRRRDHPAGTREPASSDVRPR